MKKFILLGLLMLGALWSNAQLFTMEQDIVFRRPDSSAWAMPLVGGLNQPQLSNLDLNGDGLQDIVVFDRTGSKVLCFIAIKSNDTTTYFYDPSYEELFPKLDEFMVLEDYNGDGLADLWGYRYDIGHPFLFTNTSTTRIEFTFKKVLNAYNFDSPPFDTSKFVHFKGTFPDVVDIDGDGDLDFVSNTAYCGSNITLYLNISQEDGLGLDNIEHEIPDYCLGGLGENGIEIVLNAQCFFQKNYRKKKHCGIKTFGFFDNDGDGDMDLFFGSSEQPTNPIYFIENGKSDLGMTRDTFISIDTTYFAPGVEALIPVGPTISFLDINGDNVKDLVFSTNELYSFDYSIPQTHNVLYFTNKGTNNDPDYQYVTNELLVGDMLDFGAFTAPHLADLDGDGDLDLVIATNGDDAVTADLTHHMVRFENIGTISKPEFILRDLDFLGFKADSLAEFFPAFVDIDNDNDLDLFIGMPTGNIRFYRNDAGSYSLIDENYQNIQVGQRATPYFYDLNGDGVVDLLVGEYEGNINYFENTGTKTQANFILVEDTLGQILTNELIRQTVIDPKGGIRDTFVHQYYGMSSVGVAKLNDNNAMAIIAIGEEGKPRVFLIGDSTGAKYAEYSNTMHHTILDSNYNKDLGSMGHIATGDLNNDGLTDLIVGNSRGGINLLMGRNNVGISPEPVKERISIYPNPTSGTLLLTGISNENLDFQIFDLQGRVVQSGKIKGNIQLKSELSNGVYILAITDKQHIYSPQRFILNR